jgi:hypothetical protein
MDEQTPPPSRFVPLCIMVLAAVGGGIFAWYFATFSFGFDFFGNLIAMFAAPFGAWSGLIAGFVAARLLGYR